VDHLDIVWVIVSEGSSHAFRILMVRHHVVVVRELFLANGTYSVLLGDFAFKATRCCPDEEIPSQHPSQPTRKRWPRVRPGSSRRSDTHAVLIAIHHPEDRERLRINPFFFTIPFTDISFSR
jgi:hypothetical protein